MDDSIDYYRKKAGLSMEALAKASGVSRSYLQKLKSGDKRWNMDTLRRVAKALGVSTKSLVNDDEIPLVRVIGRTGAGSEVIPIDDEPLVRSNMVAANDSAGVTRYRAMDEGDIDDGGEYVECPSEESPRGIGAIRVEGDSMVPQLKDGWLVFIKREHIGDIDSCIGKLCVVKIRGGKTYVKELQRGSIMGKYNLYSHNASLIENVDIEWCAKVFDIRPT